MDKIYKNYVPSLDEYVSESITFNKEYNPDSAPADIKKASSDMQNELTKMNAAKSKMESGSVTPLQYRDFVKNYIEKKAQYDYLTTMDNASSYFKTSDNNNENNNNQNNTNNQQQNANNGNQQQQQQPNTQQAVANEVGTAMGGKAVGNAFSNAVGNQ